MASRSVSCKPKEYRHGKHTRSSWIYLASVIFGSGAVYAQGAPEVIVRPGDTIQWAAISGGPHQVWFSGANGASSRAQIVDILDNFSAPGLDADGKSQGANTGALLSATVKDAPGVVGKTFVFTCGIHPAAMLSLTFTVADKVAGQGPRTHRILGESGSHWHLHVDTTQ